MKKRLGLALLALIASLALFSSAAFAGSTGGGDDPQNNATTLGGGAPSNGCDTLDGFATAAVQSRRQIVYKCVPDLDITGWSFATEIDPTTGKLALHGSMTVRGVIPDEANPATGRALLAANTVGANFVWFYQNPRAQNKRQIIGDTVDCQRKAHSGPFLTDNNEYLALYYHVSVTPDQDVNGDPLISDELGWATYDPVSITLSSRIAKPKSPNGAQGRCVNGVMTPGFSDPGTVGARKVISGNRLDVWIPATFHSYAGVTSLYLPSDYVLAAPGDPIVNVFPQIQGLIPFFSTPPVNLPDGSQALGPQYLYANPPIDWSPWSAYDLGEATGTMTIGVASLPGPKCPQYVNVVPGSGVAQGGDYEVQVNPAFFGNDLAGGLNHYDASGEPGTTTNPVKPQDHAGPRGCNIRQPFGQWHNGSNASFSA